MGVNAPGVAGGDGASLPCFTEETTASGDRPSRGPGQRSDVHSIVRSPAAGDNEHRSARSPGTRSSSSTRAVRGRKPPSVPI